MRNQWFSHSSSVGTFLIRCTDDGHVPHSTTQITFLSLSEIGCLHDLRPVVGRGQPCPFPWILFPSFIPNVYTGLPRFCVGAFHGRGRAEWIRFDPSVDSLLVEHLTFDWVTRNAERSRIQNSRRPRFVFRLLQLRSFYKCQLGIGSVGVRCVTKYFAEPIALSRKYNSKTSLP